MRWRKRKMAGLRARYVIVDEAMGMAVEVVDDDPEHIMATTVALCEKYKAAVNAERREDGSVAYYVHTPDGYVEVTP